MNIPIYRAKKIGSDEYVEGFYIEDHGVASYIQESKYLNFIVSDRGEKGMEVDTLFQIDPTTLAIHFSDMLDSNGNKIFASLQKDGKGGDIVISKSYPFYGDAPELTDSSGKCEELNYKGLLLFTSTGCYMDYIKVSDRVRGCAIGCSIEDFNEFKSIEIQE